MSAIPNAFLERVRAAMPAQDDVPCRDGVQLLSAASVQPQAVTWLWNGWLARGKLHVLAGAPGTGKTTLALALGAAISRGARFPDGSRTPQGNVVMWSGEDSFADVLVPRFMSNEGDRQHLFLVDGTRVNGERRAFDPAEDMIALANAVRGIEGGVSLLIVDPLVSAVKGDSHKNAEVRRALEPLAHLANECGCAVIGITHLTKGSSGREPIERVTGSLAFGAIARVVLVATKQAESKDDARLLVRAKSNVGPDGGGITYTLTQVAIPDAPHIAASSIIWGAPVTGDARDLMADAEPSGSDEDRSAIDDASQFLFEQLDEGPVPVKDLQKNADGAGIAWRTVCRAKQKIGIKAEKSSFNKGWRWRLPEPAHAYIGAKDAKTAEEDHTNAVASFDDVGILGKDEEEI